MSKLSIGFLFILAGLAYGSLANDKIYDATLGYLVANKWLRPPVSQKPSRNALGRKATIIIYSLALIAIGLYLLWNHNI